MHTCEAEHLCAKICGVNETVTSVSQQASSALLLRQQATSPHCRPSSRGGAHIPVEALAFQPKPVESVCAERAGVTYTGDSNVQT